MQSTSKHRARLVVMGRELEVIARLGVSNMFLETSEPLPYGTEARLRIAGIDVPVTVRWKVATGVGVQCGALRARDVWSIHRLTARA